MRVIIFWLASAVLTLTLAACTGVPDAPQTVRVMMTDYTFGLTPERIRPGEVTFLVENDATTTLHQLVMVKTYLPADELPDAVPGRMLDAGADVFTLVGAVSDLDPGQAGVLKAWLEPGHYVYLCDTPGHYRRGMYGEFTVSP
jgi:uncharacterized cupredoxin-like copper-binding protein